MKDLAAIRTTCANAINEVSGIQIAYDEVLVSERMKDQESRCEVATLDDQVERFLLSARSRSESTFRQASQILASLHLHGNESTQAVTLGDLSTQQAIDQIHNLLSVCEETFRRIQLTANELGAERKKWWKFW